MLHAQHRPRPPPVRVKGLPAPQKKHCTILHFCLFAPRAPCATELICIHEGTCAGRAGPERTPKPALLPCSGVKQ